MTMSSGRGTNRRSGHNYIGKQAEARLQEILRPGQQRGLNALQVDSFEVMYYRRSNSSVPCSCHRTTAPGLEHNEAGIGLGGDASTFAPEMSAEDEIVFDHGASLFGTTNTSGFHEDAFAGPGPGGMMGDDDEAIEDDEEGYGADTPFGHSVDCGICYRNGMVPGYELYGHDRKILAFHNLVDTYGYTVDQSAAPHEFVQVDPREGFVDFDVDVPKYFKSVRFSVRNGINQLSDEVLYQPTPAVHMLNEATLRVQAGRTARIRVRTPHFTHVVIEFDLGLEPVRAALAQDNKATDWTMFDTLGSMSLILPMTIGSVETSDVVYVPSRKRTVKISDVTYLRTARDVNMDWQVQARVLQPQEGLKRIYQSLRLL